MELTRLINAHHIDFRAREIRNIAFKPSGGDCPETPDGKCGISVIDVRCACPPGNADCICKHASKYYPAVVASEPFLYWTFDESILAPPTPNPEQVPMPVLFANVSDTGDDCHYTIHHIGRKRASRLFKEHGQPYERHLRICSGGTSLHFDWSNLQALLAGHVINPAS
jgi:hypothetical protein